MNFRLFLESTGMVLTAWHCGSEFDVFSTAFSGTGEGMIVLGPGIYFVTNEHIAKLYCKYARTAQAGLYEAEIDTTNFYCFGSSWNRNPEQSKIVGARADKIAQELGYEDGWAIKGFNSLDVGKPPIGGIVKILGKKKALQVLVDNHIQGALEYIQPGIIEMAVFDPSVIKLKQKTSVPKVDKA